MKTKLSVSIPLLLSAAFFAGCNPDNNPPSPVGTIPPTNGMAASLSNSKDEFLAAAHQKMLDLDAKIQELSNKSGDLKDDAKVQADKALDELRKQRAALGKEYDNLKQSSQDTWDKTKAAFSAGLDDVQKAYQDAKAKFTSP
jgi:hypothetical protein